MAELVMLYTGYTYIKKVIVWSAIEQLVQVGKLATQCSFQWQLLSFLTQILGGLEST